MRPSDPTQNPGFAAFLRQTAQLIEANWHARGITMPPGVIEVFGRVALEHVATHPPSPNTFLDFSVTRLVTIVRQIENELPGGHTNPAFKDLLADRIRAAITEQGGGKA